MHYYCKHSSIVEEALPDFVVRLLHIYMQTDVSLASFDSHCAGFSRQSTDLGLAVKSLQN